MHLTSVLFWIIIAAFCVRDACGCARRLKGAHVWDLMGRGIDSMLIADLHQPWGESSCTRCGKCVQVCPTGALSDKKQIWL